MRRIGNGRRWLTSGAVLLVAALAFLVLGYAGLQAVRAEAPDAIRTRLTEELKFLASDELEGRGVGTKGLDRAAEFIRREFAEAGLDVHAVNGDAWQPFTMVTGAELAAPNTLTFIDADGNKQSLQLNRDFQVCSFGSSGRFSGGVVFCGYGIRAKDKQYDEFAGVDVKDKVVIILRRVPRQGVPNGPFTGPHGNANTNLAALRTKVRNAVSAGAAAILFVNDPYTGRVGREKLEKSIAEAKEDVEKARQNLQATDADDAQARKKAEETLQKAERRLADLKASLEKYDADPLMKFGYGGTNPRGKTVPIVHISQEVCSRLLQQGLGKTLEELEAAIDEDLKPRSAELAGTVAEGETTIRRIESEVRNVIGVLPGEGPLADETIVVGAHYDHIGLGGSGSLAGAKGVVHNGADDNASGTVALIELARRLAARPKPLPRRIVFIAFTAEESGLIGSAHYVKQPVFPLEKTIAMFNMDMVGRLRDGRLTVFGSGTSSRWKPLLEQLGPEYGLQLTLKPSGFGPSDHSSFYGKKIPVLHFFTGTHADYHRPTDDWDKINYEGIRQIVDLIEEVVVRTAEEPKRPDYVAVKTRAQINRSGSRPYFGSIPDFAGGGEGYAISGVAPGSPAEKAGLKGGDQIVKLGRHEIGGLEDFDYALRQFKAGETVEVVVLRDGKRLTLKVTLDTPR